jgi:hypothetical protein
MVKLRSPGDKPEIDFGPEGSLDVRATGGALVHARGAVKVYE